MCEQIWNIKGLHIHGLLNHLSGARYLEQAESFSRFILQAESVVQGRVPSLTIIMVQNYAAP